MGNLFCLTVLEGLLGSLGPVYLAEHYGNVQQMTYHGGQEAGTMVDRKQRLVNILIGYWFCLVAMTTSWQEWRSHDGGSFRQSVARQVCSHHRQEAER